MVKLDNTKESIMKKNTRDLLINSAYHEFYKNGYQGANIAKILQEVGINKGSMYHFFKSKKELGIAVIEERIGKNILEKYSKILDADNVIETLFQTLSSSPSTLVYGCPLNKMSQEMLYLDDDFKKILSSVYLIFEEAIENILIKSIEKGEIETCDTKSTARVVIATYEGALMIYHLNQNIEQYIQILNTLKSDLFNYHNYNR